QEGPPLWFGAVVEGLLADENPLSRAVSGKAAGREPLGELPPPLLAAAAHDLRMLQRLAHFRPEVLEAAVRRWEPASPRATLAGRGHAGGPAAGGAGGLGPGPPRSGGVLAGRGLRSLGPVRGLPLGGRGTGAPARPGPGPHPPGGSGRL